LELIVIFPWDSMEYKAHNIPLNQNKEYSDNFSLRFSEAIAYVSCIVVSTAMIWYLIAAIYSCQRCTDNTFEYASLLAFVLIISSTKIKLLIMWFCNGPVKEFPACAD
jgi:hypothetical protein